MMNETVSILVPVYGVETYIAACAESLFSQSYGNIEYIFVDDCTPDRSIEVMREVLAHYPERENQVRVIRHEHNRGLGAARATAFDAATGEYFMHVDSDDRLASGAVEVLVEKMKESGADIVDGGFADMNGGEIVRTVHPVPLSDRKYLRKMLCQKAIPHNVWGRLYRRSFVLEHHIFSVEGIDYAEDFALTPRLLLFAKRACVDQTVYYYSIDNTSSYTHRLSEKNMLSYLRAYKLVMDFFEAEPEGHRYRKALDIGMVKAYKEAVLNGISVQQLDKMFPYRLHSFLPRLCVEMMRRGYAMRWVNTIFRPMRRLHIWLS